MRDQFSAAGIEFSVVSGDLIEGTFVARILERIDPDAIAARRSIAKLPTVTEFARAVADAAVGPSRDGDVVLVGGPDYARLA